LLNYAQKIACLKAGPTDQGTVYLRLLYKLGDIVGGDAAPVEDAHRLGSFLAALLRDMPADKADGLVGLLAGSRFTCADSPDGLVG
jgi:hypothetical protein